jgi:CHAD domain-containing protein
VLRFRRGLRRAARALGDVRDWDVFLGDLRARAAVLTDAEAALLDPLIEAASVVRAAARVRLIHDLDAGRYARFKHEFAVFLTTPGAALAALPASGAPPLVRDVAGSTVWQRYEQWRAFEAALPEADDLLLHQARIAGKRLRYTLEFFAEALGPRTDKLLEQLSALQEHLGHIQDAAAARAHIATLGMHEDPGAQAYLAQLESARAELLAALPQVWGKVGGEPYRRKLMELLVKL